MRTADRDSVKLEHGILHSRALAQNSTISRNSSIPGRWLFEVRLSLSYFLKHEEFERCFHFFFLVLLAHNLFAIFFYNFSCSSCAGEFSRHFVCGKSLHIAVVFFHGKKLFEDIFH